MASRRNYDDWTDDTVAALRRVTAANRDVAVFLALYGDATMIRIYDEYYGARANT